MSATGLRFVAALLCLSACAATRQATRGPQAELERLARPWRQVGAWLTGAPRRRRAEELSGKLTAAALEEELEKEAEAEEESKIKWGFVVGILALGATFIGGYILERNHFTRLPEAGVGLLMGMLVSYLAIATGNDVMAQDDKFDFEFFMTWLLPPIIFEAGYNMNVPAFLTNLGPTMFFAFIGTFASTFVVGGIVWQFGQMGVCYPMGMLASLTFGSLISATDPVTVLAVFQELGVKVDLFSMVFGESVLNDAVAIVISRTLLGLNKPGTEVNAESIQAAAVSFGVIFGGSLIIGAIFGIISALVFKAMDMRHHTELTYMQAALSFAFPWAAYFTSEALELSGIVTILFCGMIMAGYTRHNFAEEARDLTAKGYKCVAVVAETYVFVYLGMAVFTFPIFDHTVGKLVLVATLACFVGRLHIYIGSWLTNCFRKEGDVPPIVSGTYMFIMWFSGLRGGVAFALASVSFADRDFPQTCGGLTDDQKVGLPECESGMTDSLAIMQTTLVIAAFTIFVFGGAITEVCEAFGVIETPESAAVQVEAAAKLAAGNGCLPNLHRTCMTPWLTFADEVALEEPEVGLRAKGTVEHAYQETYMEDSMPPPPAASSYSSVSSMDPGLPSSVIKRELSANSGIEMMSIDDKIDEMRSALPSYSAMQLRKLLDENNGILQQAIIAGQGKGFQ